VALDSGLTLPSFADLQLKQALIRAGAHVYLVADSTKINRSSFTRLGTLDVIHSFITDDGIRDEDVRAFQARGIQMIIAIMVRMHVQRNIRICGSWPPQC
jgi:DeoR/GlpR family transcriptional regulator of sugar metabolism